MSERLGPSAISGRAGPGTRAPARAGAPPGGRSLESFSPKISSAKPETPSFESVRPLNIKTTPSRIPTKNNEITPVQTLTFKQLTPEIKTQIRATQKTEIPQAFKSAFAEKASTSKNVDALQVKKGSERFNALGQTIEYKPSFSTNKINRAIDPLEKPISKNEVSQTKKIAETPKEAIPKTEIPIAFQKAFEKSPELNLDPAKLKVPEAFQNAFKNSQESTLDPTKAVVPKAFVDAFPDGQILDPSIPKPTPAEILIKIPTKVPKSDASLVIPENVVNVIPASPEVAKDIAKLNNLPKGSGRFKKSPELIAQLYAQKAIKTEKPLNPQITSLTPKFEIKPDFVKNQSPQTEITEVVANAQNVIKEIKNAPLETKRQMITKLLTDQKVSLPESLLKENEALRKDIPTNTRRDLMRNLMRSNSLSLNGALHQTETGIPVNNERLQSPTRADLIKKVLSDQSSVGLIEAMKTEPITNGTKQKLQTIITDAVAEKLNKFDADAINKFDADAIKSKLKSSGEVGSLDALNENINELRRSQLITHADSIPMKNITVLAEAAQQIETEDRNKSKDTTPKVTPGVLEQITRQDHVLDLSKARELLRQNEQVQSTTVESAQQAATLIKKEGEYLNGEVKDTNYELQTKAIQLAESLLNHDQKVIIQPNERNELIDTLTELGKTTQYKENPQLQQAVMVLLKEQTTQIIEEQQVSNTIQTMVEAGIEPELIQAQVNPVVEQKQLSITPEQLNRMIETTTLRIHTKLEQQYIEEEELDECELMLQRIRMLYIELDDIAMQHRIESSLNALEKAFEKAYEEGRESVAGSEIYALIPQEEPSAEKSELIKMLNIDRNDGSRVEYAKTVNTEETFDSPAKAYEFIMNALFANRPGRVRENPTNSLLSQQEIEKIYREQSYPTQKIVNFSSYNNSVDPLVFTTTLHQQAA